MTTKANLIMRDLTLVDDSFGNNTQSTLYMNNAIAMVGVKANWLLSLKLHDCTTMFCKKYYHLIKWVCTCSLFLPRYKREVLMFSHYVSCHPVPGSAEELQKCRTLKEQGMKNWLHGSNWRGAWKKALTDFWLTTTFSFQIAMYLLWNKRRNWH